MCCTRLAKKYRMQKLAICTPSHNFIGLYLRNFVSDTAVFMLKRDVKLQPTNLLQQRRSTEVHQTLHNVWPSAGLVYYIYILGALAPYRNSARCKIQFTSKSCVLLFWQRYCTALEQWASAKLCGMVDGMELWNFCCSSFSTEGATYILRAAMTLG